MDHVCANCCNFEEGICIAHSCGGCERYVRYPYSYGTDCNDFEPIEPSTPSDDDNND